METIASFTIDHTKLRRGIYVSRKDKIANEVITTIDIRMKEPNKEPVMNTAELHTIEHVVATFLRNSSFKDNILYFGPMGCRTGNYLLVKGDYNSSDLVSLIREAFLFLANFDGEIPGYSPKECGNYLDHNLPMAKYEAKKFVEEVLDNIKEENLNYPS